MYRNTAVDECPRVLEDFTDTILKILVNVIVDSRIVQVLRKAKR